MKQLLGDGNARLAIECAARRPALRHTSSFKLSCRFFFSDHSNPGDVSEPELYDSL
jgi:hypothetical protein